MLFFIREYEVNFIFKMLINMLVVFFATHAYGADQVKSVAVGPHKTGGQSELPLQGSVTIPGNTQVFIPLPPAEVEKLGREGVKQKMMEQKH